jgi:Cft2 family RNA processing exonuclease
MARPGFGGPETAPGELVSTRPGWLLGLLAEFPPLRTLVRARSAEACAALVAAPAPDDHDEALCRLMLHPDPGVRDAAARVALTEPPPVMATATAASLNDTADKRVRTLERRLAESQKRRRQAEGKLRHLRLERDRALAAQSGESGRREEASEEAEQARAETDLLRAEHRNPRVLGRRLLRLWDADGPAPSSDPRERGTVSPEGPARTAIRGAVRTAGAEAEVFIRVLRSLADPPGEERRGTARLTVGGERAPRVVQLGGGTEIGGSCVLIEAGSTRILVDAGLRQAGPEEQVAPPGLANLPSGPLDAVVVTHAHNDHAGYVPELLRDRGPFQIVTTPVTAELLPTMWTDTAKVARGLGRVRPSGTVVSYGREEVQAAGAALVPLETGIERVIGDLTVELFPAGHVIGAAGVVVRAGEYHAVVTGDVADFAQASVGACEVPQNARGADLLVVESTCCDQSLSHRDHTVKRMLDTVDRVCSGGGRVLVPAMSLGRAQEVALILRHGLPEVPVLVDGMARTIAELVGQATAGTDKPVRVLGDNVRGVVGSQRTRLVETFRGGVVISPAGNMSGGPVVEWARAVLPDPRSAVLVAGRQDEESPGGRLAGLVNGGNRRFVLQGRSWTEEVDVRSRVADTRLSAHADQQGLLRIVEEVGARRVRLVHGFPKQQHSFGRLLTGRGYQWELGVHGA